MQASRAFRRCHICGATCEASAQIKKCSDCGKPFAPFYYFDDRFSPVHAEGTLRPPPIEGQWRPIHGLTAYWQPD